VSSPVVGLPDWLDQSLIFLVALTRFSLAAGILPTFRNSEHMAHRFHGILLLMILNKLISPPYAHRSLKFQEVFKNHPLKHPIFEHLNYDCFSLWQRSPILNSNIIAK
jgi:hypothetical protein